MFSSLDVFQMQRIPQKEVWPGLWHWKGVWILPNPLGLQKSLALPVFHAINRLWHRVVLFFAGKSKESVWDTWNMFPEVTGAFLEISTAPSEVLPYEVLWYCSMTVKASSSRFVKARDQLFFTRSCSLDRIPPSCQLQMYEAAHPPSSLSRWPRWPELPSPAEWGRERNGQWKPVWAIVATSPTKLLRAYPLFLQEGLQRVVQVFKSKCSV